MGLKWRRYSKHLFPAGHGPWAMTLAGIAKCNSFEGRYDPSTKPGGFKIFVTGRDSPGFDCLIGEPCARHMVFKGAELCLIAFRDRLYGLPFESRFGRFYPDLARPLPDLQRIRRVIVTYGRNRRPGMWRDSDFSPVHPIRGSGIDEPANQSSPTRLNNNWE